MIDIWGIGPEIDKMELLIGSMGELLRYILHFILVYAAAYLIRRFVPERGRTAASVLLALVPAAFVWMTGRKSEFAFSFLWAALLAAEARTLGVVSLENVETAFLFSAMMFRESFLITRRRFWGICGCSGWCPPPSMRG